MGRMVQAHYDADPDLTWRAYARQCGCTVSAIRFIAAAETRNVSLDLAMNIARVIGCKVEDFY